MRLINADALKETMIQVLERIKKNPNMNGQEMHLIAGMKMLGEMIDDSETVPAIPVEWITKYVNASGTVKLEQDIIREMVSEWIFERTYGEHEAD